MLKNDLETYGGAIVKRSNGVRCKELGKFPIKIYLQQNCPL